MHQAGAPALCCVQFTTPLMDHGLSSPRHPEQSTFFFVWRHSLRKVESTIQLGHLQPHPLQVVAFLAYINLYREHILQTDTIYCTIRALPSLLLFFWWTHWSLFPSFLCTPLRTTTLQTHWRNICSLQSQELHSSEQMHMKKSQKIKDWLYKLIIMTFKAARKVKKEQLINSSFFKHSLEFIYISMEAKCTAAGVNQSPAPRRRCEIFPDRIIEW